MGNFEEELQDFCDKFPGKTEKIRSQFPEVFKNDGVFIIHMGSDKEKGVDAIDRLYFFSNKDEHKEGRYLSKLNGRWSSETLCAYPDKVNLLFTGTVKIVSGRLVKAIEEEEE